VFEEALSSQTPTLSLAKLFSYIKDLDRNNRGLTTMLPSGHKSCKIPESILSRKLIAHLLKSLTVVDGATRYVCFKGSRRGVVEKHTALESSDLWLEL